MSSKKTATKPAPAVVTEDLIDPKPARSFSPPTTLKFKTLWGDPESLTPYFNNTKQHSTEQVDKIAGSIAAFKFDQPIVVDGQGVIIKGHGRREAALRLGIKEVPYIVRTDLTEDEVNQARIADNRVAESPWDKEKLAFELKNLAANNCDMTPLGFEQEELKDYMTYQFEELPLVDKTPDAAPEPPVIPISVKGDVWLCGPHRIMCGDCTSPTDMETLMGNDRFSLIFTDPPYGVSFQQGAFCPTAGKKFRDVKIANDDLKGEGLTDFIRDAFTTALLYKAESCAVYAWSACMIEGGALAAGLLAAGIHLQSKIIWAKHTFVMGRCDYHWQHEECWYGYVGVNHPWYGERNKGSVWNVDKMRAMELHPTQKPWELAEIGLTNSSKQGDVVLDIFGGSGMTLIAADKLKRRARIMDVEPRYVDVMVRRWCEFTGEDAKRESDGADWLDLKMAHDAFDAK